jgi:hypothetical protein
VRDRQQQRRKQREHHRSLSKSRQPPHVRLHECGRNCKKAPQNDVLTSVALQDFTGCFAILAQHDGYYQDLLEASPFRLSMTKKATTQISQ